MSMKSEYFITPYNIIQTHSSVLWDWQVFNKIFSIFKLNVKNHLKNNVSPTEHYYEFE
jgi:hypothetical protein